MSRLPFEMIIAKVTIPTGSESGYNPSVTSLSDSTVASVLGQVYFIAGIVAVITIIVAGFIFVTSQGNANRVAQARMAILASSIGLLVIIFAFVITQFVIGWVAG